METSTEKWSRCCITVHCEKSSMFPNQTWCDKDCSDFVESGKVWANQIILYRDFYIILYCWYVCVCDSNHVRAFIRSFFISSFLFIFPFIYLFVYHLLSLILPFCYLFILHFFLFPPFNLFFFPLFIYLFVCLFIYSSYFFLFYVFYLFIVPFFLFLPFNLFFFHLFIYFLIHSFIRSLIFFLPLTSFSSL